MKCLINVSCNSGLTLCLVHVDEGEEALGVRISEVTGNGAPVDAGSIVRLTL